MKRSIKRTYKNFIKNEEEKKTIYTQRRHNRDMAVLCSQAEWEVAVDAQID
jgi:hypothetical protein